MTTKTMLRVAAGAALLLAAGGAAAHPGHAATGLAEGLAHPLGLDHLLAMLAVGVWSAAALAGPRRWLGPLAFLSAMTAGALLAVAGLALPFVEQGLAASLLVFGALLAFATRVPAAAGLALITTTALLHGFAHGSELPPGASATAYALGFLASTTLLHAGGLGLGAALRERSARLWQAGGALLGLAGLVLLARI